MKRNHLLTGICFFITLFASGQKTATDSLTEYYYKYPATAVKSADSLYQKAINEHNNPLMIKSLIQKTNFNLQIDKDRYPELLDELETRISQEKEIAVKSVLHSYAGELYARYYRENNYAISQRTFVSGYVPENINEWSSQLFKEKIFAHYLASIEAQKDLQQIPLSDYALILVAGKASDSLRPTLYDFLCRQALESLPDEAANSREKKFAAITDSPTLLAGTDEFTAMQIPDISPDSPSRILQIYRDLLLFHQQDGNRNALLMADLHRLEYANRISTLKNKRDLYLAALRELKRKYEDLPMVVEVMDKEAETIQEDYTLESLKQALAICEAGVRKYPDYSRINLLHKQINNIQEPNIQIEYPSNLHPGQGITLKIKSRNIDSITFTLYKVKETTHNYRRNARQKDSSISREVAYHYTCTLANSLNMRDTILHLPTIPEGLYEITVSRDTFKNQISRHFICTRLFTVEQATRAGHRFLVRDIISGRPVAGAKIRLYNATDQLIDSIYTDKQGRAATSADARKYETVNAQNPNGYLSGMRYRDEHSFGNTSPRTDVYLTTDRTIYRPGQTVFFKGIAWTSSPDTLYVLQKRTFDVIAKNANNGKEFFTKSFTTNDFGSFTGQFVIPGNLLNGNILLQSGKEQIYIRIADYKRPEFDITFAEPEKRYYFDDLVKVKGSVGSFSGVPYSKQKVKYEISYQSFLRWKNNTPVIQGITHTNEKGEFTLEFKAVPPAISYTPIGFGTYQVRVSATDDKGETQTFTTEVPVYSRQAKPVIHIPEVMNKNVPAIFRFLVENAESGESHTLHYSIFKLKKPEEINERLQIKDTLIEKIMLEGTLHTQGNDTCRLVPELGKWESGAYLVTVQNKDVTSKQVFYLYAPTDKRPPIPVYDWLVSEKTECSPGETAVVLFGTSARNVHIRYEIYTSDWKYQLFQRKVSDEVIRIEIPWQASYGEQIWLYIDYVKDGHYVNHTIPIKKIRKNRELILETKVFRDKLTPGQEEQWEMTVKDKAGQAVKAEVLAMMYDASLEKLEISRNKFIPAYEYERFRNYWSANYNPDSRAYMWLSLRDYNIPGFRIPSLPSDRLNTFSHVEMIYNETEATFGDYIEDKISSSVARTNEQGIRIRGTAALKGAGEVSFRKNFAETAFFYPQLQTNSDGNVFIHFTVPESVTRWKFIALAHTQDLSTGETSKYITTSRELMVRPNMPRFFRNGDRAEIKVTVSNLSDSRQQGQATLELFVPQTTKVLSKQAVDFNIAAGESQTVSFTFDVPQGIDLTGCRISATSGAFSDGEQHLVPILPDQILVNSTLPIYSTTQGTHSFTLKNGSSRPEDNYRLTLELTSNPVWYAVLALPAMLEPRNESATDIAGAFYVNTLASRLANANPKIADLLRTWTASPGNGETLLSKLEQNSELKSILLEASPWVMQAQNETERMQSLQQLFDANRLEYLQTEALKKLGNLQSESGGWSWFKGMNSSRFITANVLAIMAQANITGDKEYGETEKMMQINALRYLDHEIRKDFEKKTGKIGYDQLVYLYTRSMYRDIPLGDALSAHKYYMSLVQKQWSAFSFYEKAIAATTLYRYGMATDARAILKSLRQYAVTTSENGMYWPNNRNGFYRNSAIQTHTAIMEAFQEIEGNIPAMNPMKQWLLNQKRNQNWGSVPATVNAIHAILLSGSDQLSTPENLSVFWGNKQVTVPANTNPLGYVKTSVPAENIAPDMLTVKITKTTDSPTWGGMYLQHFEKLDKIKKEAGGLSIDKKLFIEQTDANGVKILIPTEKQSLKIGDKVVVRLVLSLDRDMDFLHVKDLRAACFEPENQISGSHWNFGTIYYQEVKDAATNLFFNSLSRGTYVIEYGMRANQAGDYQDGIATFQSFYSPEFNAMSASEKITIKNK